MAEIIFDCPACKQAVQADDAWAGQEIQCPLCHAAMIVPQGHAPAPHEPHFTGKGLVEVPKETKLKAGGTQVARTTSGSGPVIRNFQQQSGKKQNLIIKYATTVVVLVALGVGGWFGWPYLKPHLPFLNKDGAAEGVAGTATNPGADAAATPEAAAPPPPKEIPMTLPTHTLDVAQAQVSEGKVNGSIAGTNFVPDAVRLDKVGSQYVLDLRQGAGVTPDRGLKVILNLGATMAPTGQTWTVSQEMKGTPVSRVVKVWKTNPKYAAQEKAFTTGFALKLEFGQLTESNTIPGKIYAALPDNEKSVVGGVFEASVIGVASGTMSPTPAAANPQPDAPSAEFQRRYGPARR